MDQARENDAASDDDSRTQTSDHTLDQRKVYSKKYRFDHNEKEKKEKRSWIKRLLTLRNFVLIVLVAMTALNSVQIFLYRAELSVLQAKARKLESLFRNVFNKDLSQISTNDVLSTFSKVSRASFSDLVCKDHALIVFEMNRGLLWLWKVIVRKRQRNKFAHVRLVNSQH